MLHMWNMFFCETQVFHYALIVIHRLDQFDYFSLSITVGYADYIAMARLLLLLVEELDTILVF